MTDDRKVKTRTSLGDKELDKAQEQFEAFDAQVKDMSFDKLNAAPKKESEPQTKMAQADIAKSNDIYLKPAKSISSREKFNEDYRNDYNFMKEYVQIIAENKEVIGDDIEIWTKPFAGMPAEFWRVPVNKPVWCPRYLAEQIKRKYYHRLKTENKTTNVDGHGSYTGAIVVDTTIQRLDAYPAMKQRSIFMGANNF